LVRANRSHAALVYDGPDVVGWCQFGPAVELPGGMSGYGKMDVAPPDWRTTCFFLDREHRREGVARHALEGALRFITAKGGGTVDGYPIAIPRAKKYSSSFIWGGTESMYLDQGFRPLGSLGTSKRVMVMRKVVRGRSYHLGRRAHTVAVHNCTRMSFELEQLREAAEKYTFHEGRLFGSWPC